LSVVCRTNHRGPAKTLLGRRIPHPRQGVLEPFQCPDIAVAGRGLGGSHDPGRLVVVQLFELAKREDLAIDLVQIYGEVARTGAPGRRDVRRPDVRTARCGDLSRGLVAGRETFSERCLDSGAGDAPAGYRPTARKRRLVWQVRIFRSCRVPQIFRRFNNWRIEIGREKPGCCRAPLGSDSGSTNRVTPSARHVHEQARLGYHSRRMPTMTWAWHLALRRVPSGVTPRARRSSRSNTGRVVGSVW
jgi:hypothetical protein